MINRMIIHLILALVNRLSLSLTCVCYSFGQVLDIYQFVILNDSFYFCHFRIELTLLIHLVHEIHNYVGLRAFLLLNATYVSIWPTKQEILFSLEMDLEDSLQITT